MSTGMPAGTPPPPAADTLVAGLLDDAALFPPGNAPMPAAARDHLAHRSAWYADLVGPFLCPARRVPELLAALPALTAPLRVGLLADASGLDGLRRAAERLDERVELVHVEAPLSVVPDVEGFEPAVRALLAAAPSPRVFIEVPRGSTDEALRAVAAAADRSGTVGAKFRTGGETRTAFPSTVELAQVLRLAIDLDLAVKLTAGLHHAVRSQDPATGFVAHGFLNVLVAVRRALLGDEAEELSAVLDERDPDVLLAEVERMSEPDAIVVRSFFPSFGCCGVTDPVSDLAALGLVAGPAFRAG